jgi:hypothetical protein
VSAKIDEKPLHLMRKGYREQHVLSCFVMLCRALSCFVMLCLANYGVFVFSAYTCSVFVNSIPVCYTGPMIVALVRTASVIMLYPVI